jgi:hypothetical protein
MLLRATRARWCMAHAEVPFCMLSQVEMRQVFGVTFCAAPGRQSIWGRSLLGRRSACHSAGRVCLLHAELKADLPNPAR